MNNIVFLNTGIRKQDLYTTSDIIAEYAEVTHHAIQQIISRHEKDLKEFGAVAFDVRAVKQKRGVNEQKIYHLNEQQATLVITYLKNTAPVRAFKKELVRQFFLMRSELMKRQQLRTELKPIRRELTDAIRDRPDLSCNKWAYKTYTDLAYKQVTGKTAAVLKKERGAAPNSTAVTFLTAEELEALQVVSNQIAVLIDLGMDYEEIKTAIKNGCKPLQRKPCLQPHK